MNRNDMAAVQSHGSEVKVRSDLDLTPLDLHGDPVLGFFGPESVSWQVARERFLYLAGIRTLLMQVAHPRIARAGVEHSNFYIDPVGRFQRTFATVHAMVFGTQQQAIHAADRLYAIHQQIKGPLAVSPQGQDEYVDIHANANTNPNSNSDNQGVSVANLPDTGLYDATDSHLLMWVYATLIDSAILISQQVVPPDQWVDWDAYYQESKKFALLCGVQPDILPATRTDFHTWVQNMVESDEITVTQEARHINKVLLTASPMSRVLSPVMEALTAGLLPPKLRAAYDYRWDAQVERSYDRYLWWTRVLLPYVPTPFRYVRAYHGANQRCQQYPLSGVQ
ncbi:MAG: oxygenase MpaB family protein [Chloroflexota bacterium]